MASPTAFAKLAALHGELAQVYADLAAGPPTAALALAGRSPEARA